MKNVSVKVLLLALAFTTLSLASAFADEYEFKVTNNTNTVIAKILVSQDGERYGFLDIGRGIKPGRTVTLEWSKQTNSGGCQQYVKAVYADGSESEPTTFDFCDPDVALEFSDSGPQPITTPATGTVSGTVMSGGDGVADASLDFAPTGGGDHATATSGSNGQYTRDYLVPGTYDVTCSAAGFNSRTKRVSVVTDKTVPLDFKLERK